MDNKQISIIKSSILIISIAVVYFLSAKAVAPLSLVESGSVFAIWPPTGIALGALFLFSYRIWPGIFLGALTLNMTLTPFLPSFEIAITNTLGPIIGLWLLNKFIDKNIFDQTRTMLIFFISIIIASLITATGGSLTLLLNDIVPKNVVTDIWIGWFLGDLIGFLLITPIIHAINTKQESIKRLFSFEGILMIITLIVTSVMIFGPIVLFDLIEYPVVYFLLPVLIWSTLRFGSIVAVVSLFIIAITSINGTILGYGPFLRDDTNASLILLQSFNGMLAMTILIVASIFREKELSRIELRNHKENLEELVKKRTSELENSNKKLIEAQTKLEDININLEKKIKEEVDKNREKDQQLMFTAKMAALGDMLGNIAHQWRQPLASITMASNNILVDIDLEQSNDESVKDGALCIIEQAQYLSSTIETFRNFIKETKEPQEVILQECIDNSLNIVSATLEKNFIKVKKNIDYSYPIKLTLHKNEFAQVIINILNNAKDVLLTKESEDKWISINLEKISNHALITIEDNAGGIDENIIDNVFEPYFTTKHHSQGTGLGLHISYKIIVESLKGKIYVKNGEYGAKFFIEIPIKS